MFCVFLFVPLEHRGPTGPWPGFKVWRAKYLLGGKIFVFIILLKQIFPGITQLRGNCPDCGQRTEFLGAASFLSTDCCVYVTMLIKTSITSVTKIYNINGVRPDYRELL